MHEGVDGLLRDKTRPPGKRPLPGGRSAGRQSDARRTARRDDALDGPVLAKAAA